MVNHSVANHFVGHLLGLANQITHMPIYIYHDRNLPFGNKGKLNVLKHSSLKALPVCNDYNLTKIECYITQSNINIQQESMGSMTMTGLNVVKHNPMTEHGLNVLKHNPVTGHGLTVVKHNPMTKHGLNVLKHNPITEHGLNVVKHNPMTEHGLNVLKHNPMTDHGLNVLKHNPKAMYDKNPWIQRQIH